MFLALATYSWRHKGLLATVWERASQSLHVCSVAVWKHMGSAGSNAKGQHGQRLFRGAVFSQLRLTLAQPAIPLQACVSDFWVRETTTATWEWISAHRCEEDSQASDVPLLWCWHSCPSMVHRGLCTCEYMATNTSKSGRKCMFVHLSNSWQNSKHKWSWKCWPIQCTTLLVWSNASDCNDACRYLLGNTSRRLI